MNLLLELLDTTSEKSPDVKHSKGAVNKIAKMLFGHKAGPVVDSKRSKEPKFFGVANERSRILDAKGKGIKLTFDNSTDSGEFEINSLTPLKIVKGGDVDKEIRKLYKKYKVPSRKKTNYLNVNDEMVMREIHLGKDVSDEAIKLVKAAMKIFKGEKPDEDEGDEEPVEKKEEPKEEPKKKEPPKEEPKKEEPKKVKESIIGEAANEMIQMASRLMDLHAKEKKKTLTPAEKTELDKVRKQIQDTMKEKAEKAPAIDLFKMASLKRMPVKK